ncbi:TonB family C-terminal domain-containing protein [Sphingomonas sp. OV641]|uniref:TonB family protein n=1 Tax=Sphingomonas sp. OV641 TaxID=1881068 RepID=UPI0008C71E61|nr:TonB family protein [Sphingomonas sp. OV641]SEJ77372.1 TonB family C-terminal domain-containing protein [Sphingomonas sp. OV641]
MRTLELALILVAAQGQGESEPLRAPTNVNPPVLVSGSIGPDDYPKGSDRPSGTTKVSVEVGTDGTVTDCQIASTSGSKILDDKTCSIFKERMRYKPATMMDGKSIPYRIEHNVGWSLPGPPEPLATMKPFWNELELIISPDGKVKSCKVIKDQKPYPHPGSTPCLWATQSGDFKPFEGPSNRKLHFRFSLEVEDVAR